MTITYPDNDVFYYNMSGTTTYRFTESIPLKKGDKIELKENGGNMSFDYRFR